jgi:hypothetical protein
MSTFVRLLPPNTIDEVEQSTSLHAEPAIEREDAPKSHTAGWTLDSFAEEQIRGLVRQVFLPGWPRPCRQVVFSPVDQGLDIAAICMQVGETLADEGPGVACVVEAGTLGRERDATPTDRLAAVGGETRFGTLRDSSQQLSASLFFMPERCFLEAMRTDFPWPGCDLVSPNCAWNSITRCCRDLLPGSAARPPCSGPPVTDWYWCYKPIPPVGPPHKELKRRCMPRMRDCWAPYSANAPSRFQVRFIEGYRRRL